MLYLESAGEGLSIGPGGPWLAALDDWSRVDPSRQAMAALRWDEHYGDREQALVTISYDADPARFEEALHAALLTDTELTRGPDRLARPVRRMAHRPLHDLGTRPDRRRRERTRMKRGIHPDYHPVVFKDSSTARPS